jgi:hypothetical protein
LNILDTFLECLALREANGALDEDASNDEANGGTEKGAYPVPFTYKEKQKSKKKIFDRIEQIKLVQILRLTIPLIL